MTEPLDSRSVEPVPPSGRPGGAKDTSSQRWLAVAIVAILYAGAWLLLAPGPGKNWTYDLAHGIFGIVLLVAGIPSLIYVGRTSRLDEGGLAAVAVVLIGPVVILLGLTGLCVSVVR